MRPIRWRLGAMVVAIGWIVAGFSSTAKACQEPQQNEPEGAQVLTQGPLHEAFAEPVLFDPKPGPIVPKAPPAPITELPPEQKPEGANVNWIPGYWAWDDARNDFIWVSGIWRAIPPGRQLVPGYWQQVDGGYQWVPGYWGTTDATKVEYLPEPPASVENGPSSPPPADDATWAPGMWVWQDNQYLWRPGFWVENQPGWMWNPASYSWSPSGYVYNQGYWDYPLANRGMPFAPVYFSQPIYTQSNFAYTPGVSLLTSALFSSLFVRPSYHSYYFGDYYASNNFQSGIYPWYAFHGSRYGYDPLYSYAAAQNFRTNPRWADELHQTYNYRREHPDARPPHTFVETRRLSALPTGRPNAATSAASNLVLARPLNQLAAPGAGATAGANSQRFERIDAARRQEFAKQGAQLHQFRDDRLRREQEANRVTPAAGRSVPRQIETPRSPIVSASRGEGQRAAPPAAPQHPQVDRAMRPAAAGAAPIRHEPHPNIHPPAPYVAPQQHAAPPQQQQQRQQQPQAAPGQQQGRPGQGQQQEQGQKRGKK